MQFEGSNWIGGRQTKQGDSVFYAFDPRSRTRGSVAFANAVAEEIDQAAELAKAAFEETRGYSAARLAAFLDRVAEAIEGLGDELIAAADSETGLGVPRLTSERGRTTGQLRKFAALLRDGAYVEAIIDTAQPDRKPAPRPDIRRMLLPVGPVAVFAASNFPFAFSVAGGDMASAFAAGCPVIVKAHPGHPGTSELTARTILAAIKAEDFPAGCFSLLQGDSPVVGQTLVKHPAITAVGFTGSLRAGRAIFDTAAARPVPIPVYAEMGSVNPLVLLPGAIQARQSALASELAASVTLGSGQFCTNTGLVFLVDDPEADGFVDQFCQQMQARQPGVLLNPAIEQGLRRAVAQTLTNPDVHPRLGGQPVEMPFCGYPHTVLETSSSAFRSSPEALQAEHFGPVTLLVRCASPADLLATLSSLHGSLTASIHAEAGDLELAEHVSRALQEKCGRLIWNGYPTGVEVVAAMQHGGPYPATTAAATTSVGTTAIKRFLRPVAFQNVPDALLPDALKDANPLGIWRLVDDQWTRSALTPTASRNQ
jgi:NADP-dependent aldehyde dehydrogenase